MIFNSWPVLENLHKADIRHLDNKYMVMAGFF